MQSAKIGSQLLSSAQVLSEAHSPFSRSEKPGRQSHLYEPGVLTQTLSFLHGLASHSLISASQGTKETSPDWKHRLRNG